MVKIIAICVTVIVALIIIAVVVVYFRRKRSRETAMERGWATAGDLSRKQENALIKQLWTASTLFRQLLVAPDTWSTDFSVLSKTDRLQIEKWLQDQDSIITSLHPALYSTERLSVNKYDKFPD